MKKIFLLSTLSLLSIAAIAQTGISNDSLYKNFLTPPNAAMPRVWWHWMNGNITKDGIRKDLEWMHRVGIGGFQNFDAALATPQIVEKRLTYMEPDWIDAFKLTTKLADSLQDRSLDGPLDYVENIPDQPQRKDRPKYQLPWLTQHSNISEVFTRKSSN